MGADVLIGPRFSERYSFLRRAGTSEKLLGSYGLKSPQPHCHHRKTMLEAKNFVFLSIYLLQLLVKFNKICLAPCLGLQKPQSLFTEIQVQTSSSSNSEQKIFKIEFITERKITIGTMQNVLLTIFYR